MVQSTKYRVQIAEKNRWIPDLSLWIVWYPCMTICKVLESIFGVVYEIRSITQTEARDMVEHAKRFLEWVAGMLPRE